MEVNFSGGEFVMHHDHAISYQTFGAELLWLLHMIELFVAHGYSFFDMPMFL
jgi:hypothetical protein